MVVSKAVGTAAGWLCDLLQQRSATRMQQSRQLKLSLIGVGDSPGESNEGDGRRSKECF